MVEAALLLASAASALAIDIRTASCPRATVSSPRNKHTPPATEGVRRLHCFTGRECKFRTSVACSQRIVIQIRCGLLTFAIGAMITQYARGLRGNSPGLPPPRRIWTLPPGDDSIPPIRLWRKRLGRGGHHAGKPLLPSSAVVFVALSPTLPPPFAGAEREEPDGNVEMRPPLIGISRHCRHTRSAGRVTPSGPRTPKTGRHLRLASLLAARH